jgi:hypothetical protein
MGFAPTPITGKEVNAVPSAAFLSQVLSGLRQAQHNDAMMWLYAVRNSDLLGLLATTLFISEHYLSMGIGGMERLAAYPLPLWLIVAGISLVYNVPAPPPNKKLDRRPRSAFLIVA